MPVNDVNITVGAEDQTGATLDNINDDLVRLNNTVEKQYKLFERVEKEFMQFQQTLMLSGTGLATTFQNMERSINNVTEALKDQKKAQRDVNRETEKAPDVTSATQKDYKKEAQRQYRQTRAGKTDVQLETGYGAKYLEDMNKAYDMMEQTVDKQRQVEERSTNFANEMRVKRQRQSEQDQELNEDYYKRMKDQGKNYDDAAKQEDKYNKEVDKAYKEREQIEARKAKQAEKNYNESQSQIEKNKKQSETDIKNAEEHANRIHTQQQKEIVKNAELAAKKREQRTKELNAKQSAAEKERTQKLSAYEKAVNQENKYNAEIDKAYNERKQIKDKEYDREKKEMDRSVTQAERDKKSGVVVDARQLSNEIKEYEEGLAEQKRIDDQYLKDRERKKAESRQKQAAQIESQSKEELDILRKSEKGKQSLHRQASMDRDAEVERQNRHELERMKEFNDEKSDNLSKHQLKERQEAENRRAQEAKKITGEYDSVIQKEKEHGSKLLAQKKENKEKALRHTTDPVEIAKLNAHHNKIISKTESHNESMIRQNQQAQKEKLRQNDHYWDKYEDDMKRRQHRERVIYDEHLEKMNQTFFDKMNKRFRESRIGKSLQQIGKFMFSDVGHGLMFVAGAFQRVTQVVSEFARSIGSALVELEAMKLSLTAVEGSARKAYDQINRIYDIAKLPGVELQSAIKATVTLRALKLESELVERAIKAVGNALATLGRDAELGGVTLALSQIIGKGKVHAEEINQLAERLPLIRGILVDQFGTANTEILQRMKLSIDEFIQKVVEGLEQLPQVATTVGTALKNMNNEWFRFKSGLGTLLKPAIEGSIKAASALLEAANAALDKANEGKKQDIIRIDETTRAKEGLRYFELYKGIHEETNTQRAALAIAYQAQAKAMNEASEAAKKFAGKEGLNVIEGAEKLQADRTFKESTKNFQSINNKLQALDRQLSAVNSQLNKMTADELDDLIRMMQEYTDTLILSKGGRSEPRTDALIERFESAIITASDMLYKKTIAESTKLTGKDAEERAARLAAAQAADREDYISKKVGEKATPDLSAKEKQDIERMAESRYKPEFTGTDFDKLQIEQLNRDIDISTTKRIEGIVRTLEGQKTTTAMRLYREEYDRLKNVVKKGGDDRVKAEQDLYDLEEKAHNEMVGEVKRRHRENADLLKEQLLIRISFERRLYDEIQSIQQKVLNEFGQLYYGVGAGEKFGISPKGTNLPKSTEEIRKAIEPLIVQRMGQVSPDLLGRMISGDAKGKMENEIQSMITDLNTESKQTGQAVGPLQQAELRKIRSDLQMLFKKLRPDEGDILSKQQVEEAISVLIEKQMDPVIKRYTLAQTDLTNEIKALRKTISDINKESDRKEKDFIKSYFDPLKKPHDVERREIDVIKHALSEAEAAKSRYEGDHKMLKIIQPIIDNLTKELFTTEGFNLKTQVDAIRNSLDAEVIERKVGLDGLMKYREQFESLIPQAKSHNSVMSRIQSNLEYIKRQEVTLQKRIAKELYDRAMLLTKDDSALYDVANKARIQNLQDPSKVLPENLETYIKEVQQLLRVIASNMGRVTGFMGQSYAVPPSLPEPSDLTPIMHQRDPRLQQMINDMNAYNARQSTSMLKEIDIPGFDAEDTETKTNLMKFSQARINAEQQIQDHALSAASNMISAWENVSSHTDTMVDNVVGAVATIAVNLTQMILNIQRTSAATSAAGQSTQLLGKFAGYVGLAGLALSAGATIYSMIDQRSDDRQQRNRIGGRRPVSISGR